MLHATVQSRVYWGKHGPKYFSYIEDVKTIVKLQKEMEDVLVLHTRYTILWPTKSLSLKSFCSSLLL